MGSSPGPAAGRARQICLPPAAGDATRRWQLVGAAKPIRAKDGLLAVNGEQFRALLAGGAPIQLVLATRNGQERGRATLDRAAFDTALDLARQADARALSKSSDLRGQCTRTAGG